MAEKERKYPFHVRDINISDPFILVDEKSKKYYLYSRHFNLDKYPWQIDTGAFYALESCDLINWSEPIQVFEQGDFWRIRTIGRLSAIYGRASITLFHHSELKEHIENANVWSRILL